MGTETTAHDLVGIARGFAQDGRIDPLRNLANHRAYLFAGTNDIREGVSAARIAAKRRLSCRTTPAIRRASAQLR